MLLDSSALRRDDIGIFKRIIVIEWCWTVWQFYIRYSEGEEGQFSETHYADWALGVHVTFLNTIWWKGDGRLEHSMLMERERGKQGQDKLCFTSAKLSS